MFDELSNAAEEIDVITFENDRRSLM